MSTSDPMARPYGWYNPRARGTLIRPWIVLPGNSNAQPIVHVGTSGWKNGFPGKTGGHPTVGDHAAGESNVAFLTLTVAEAQEMIGDLVHAVAKATLLWPENQKEPE